MRSVLTPLLRLVSFRTRSLNRSTAFGAIRRLGMPALVKLQPRNFRFPWSGHCTLLLVYLELELCRDESREAFHHAFSRPTATNVDITVVRIPCKAQAASL